MAHVIIEGTAIFAVLCAVLTFMLPFMFKRNDRSLVRMMVILSTVCMWLMWLVTYVSQLNPLVPPILKCPVGVNCDD